MAQSLEDRIREYRTTASQKQAQHARAEAELEGAETRLADARAALKEEFGVETGADAKTKLEELQKELADAEAEIEKALQEAGA